jgi:hypothetical protein
MTAEMTPEEMVARILSRHFDHTYGMLRDYVAPDILNELKYYDLIALVMEKDKEIAELKTQISFERDINAGRENQLEQDIKHLRGVIDERGDLIVITEQRKKIADLKEQLEKKANND